MGDKSLNNIAKKFDLPERQSKIDSYFKPNDALYCICRSTDSTSFMICCDNCEEWFHGHCVDVTEVAAKNIKQYYCDLCRESNPELKINYKRLPKDKPDKDARRASKKAEKSFSSKSTVEKKIGRPRKNSTNTNAFAALIKEEKKIKEEKPEKEPKEVRVKRPYRKRAKVNFIESDSDEQPNPTYAGQCYGPNCVSEAVPPSKYCSPECGVRLATDRIIAIYPVRIQEWGLSMPVAELKNRDDLEIIKKKQENCLKELRKLETRRTKLDDYIDQVATLRVDPDHEDDEYDEDGTLLYCITCGHEITVKTCMRHIDKCFAKHESQTSFGSAYKTKLEGTPIFCDNYNPAVGNYCKRLKVICPEHTKENKVKDTEVCGFPLQDQHSKEGNLKVDNNREFPDLLLEKDYCQLSKKRCNRHYSWEKIKRAEIDLERVRQWLRYDELLEKERVLNIQLDNRAGLVGLMLHSTYDHELRDLKN